MTSRCYAILGTGALGGFYGARLQQAGHTVHFLLRSDYEHVKAHGLQVKSPDGNFELPQVHAHQSIQTIPPCDVIVIALKTTQNDQLPDLISPLLHPSSIILVLQNGLNIEAEIAPHFPNTTIVGGLCFLCSNKTQPGVIQHLDYGMVQLAEHRPKQAPAGVTPAMEAIAEDFRAANLAINFEPDLLLARWKKLVWNIPFNGLSVVLNAQTNQLMANPVILDLIKAIMLEIANVAAGFDRTITADFIQYILGLTLEMTPYRTSMKLDFDSGRPMEVETMFGNPIRAAQAVGVSCPKMTMLYQQLKFLDGRIEHSVSSSEHGS